MIKSYRTKQKQK